MISNLRHNHVLPRHDRRPVRDRIAGSARVDPAARVTVTAVTSGVHQVVVTFGYMDDHDVLAELRQAPPRRPPARHRRSHLLHRTRNRVIHPRRGDAAMARGTLRRVEPRISERLPLLQPAIPAGLRSRHPSRHLTPLPAHLSSPDAGGRRAALGRFPTDGRGDPAPAGAGTSRDARRGYTVVCGRSSRTEDQGKWVPVTALMRFGAAWGWTG